MYEHIFMHSYVIMLKYWWLLRIEKWISVFFRASIADVPTNKGIPSHE
jgi:hypothetical protein